VITAHLVGDEEVLARLRSIPGAVNTGLVRTVTKLGLDLQRRVQHDGLSGQTLAVRSGLRKSTIDLSLEQSGDYVTATISSGSEYAHADEFGFTGTVDVRAGLRRVKEAFGRPTSEKLINTRAHSRRMALPERSFLRSALEEMGSAIRDEVEAAVREALA